MRRATCRVFMRTIDTGNLGWGLGHQTAQSLYRWSPVNPVLHRRDRCALRKALTTPRQPRHVRDERDRLAGAARLNSGFGVFYGVCPQNRTCLGHHRPGRGLSGRVLLDKGYQVHGIKRRSSSFNTGRIEHLYQDPHEKDPQLILHYGDMTDSTNLIRIVQQMQPNEIYNLAAQSHVQVSFETPNTPPMPTPSARCACWRRSGSWALSGPPASIRPRPPSFMARFGCPAEREHAVLSALALRRRQALCLLDHGELPRGLWHARLERHPVQP